MPSRLGLALIVAFWLAVMGYVGHRDLWPRFFAEAAPTTRIDLSDEATQSVPARWSIYRGAQKIGTLRTLMAYAPGDNTFVFTSTYRDLRFDVSSLKCVVPELESVVTVSRDGEFRGQSMKGKLQAKVMVGPIALFDADATANVTSRVENGMLVGECKLESPLGNLDQPLQPVPVRGGQVLNPLQPVNRLNGIRPGRRWLVYEVNPLADAMTALAQGLIRKHAQTSLANFLPSAGDKPPLVATVAGDPVTLDRPTGGVECWLIEYRGEKATARTWVAVADGRVLRQEASGQGETLRLERED